MEKCIIVAIADNNAIGKDNALLWHISEDLKFFKRTTTGCPVIMGRKTFESIGRPLPKRTNIVISRGFTAPEGVIVVPSLSEAYNAIIQDLSCHSESVSSCHSEPVTSCHSELVEESPSRCFIIGGGQIYAQAITDADRLIVTHVHTIIEDADTFFPEIDPSIWQVEERSEMLHDDESGFDFEFVTYKRSHSNV
jgi:dihydrofolate reductase